MQFALSLQIGVASNSLGETTGPSVWQPPKEWHRQLSLAWHLRGSAGQ